MIYQERIVDLTNTPIGGKKLIFSSTNKGQILVDTALLGNTINKTITSSLNGEVTASLFNNSNYSVTLEKPAPETKWYVNSSGSFTGSVQLTGSLTTVYFDTQNIFKQDLVSSTLVVTPAASYPRHFSGSLVMLCATQSLTNAVGEVTMNIVPGIYKLTLKAGSEADDSNGYFYISGNEAVITASNAMLLSVSKGTPFKLGEGGYVVQSPSASYAVTASYAANGGGSGGSSTSSSWASSSLSASYAVTATSAATAVTANSATNADFATTATTANHATTANFADEANSATTATTATTAVSASFAITASNLKANNWS